MKALYLAYVDQHNNVLDYQTGEVILPDQLEKYSIYSYSECGLYASRYHNYDCTCKYCINGRESLSPSEY